MSAILPFDFQKRKQLRFSEVNYLNYTKKDPILHVATTFSLKQGETRTSHGPIPHRLKLEEPQKVVEWRNETWEPILITIAVVVEVVFVCLLFTTLVDIFYVRKLIYIYSFKFMMPWWLTNYLPFQKLTGQG